MGKISKRCERKKKVDGLRSKVKEFALKVYPLFLKLNWTWYEKGVPHLTDIERVLHAALDDILVFDYLQTGTGGLEVEVSDDVAEMRFVVAEQVYFDE